MVPLTSLWLPVVVSAVIVFLASSIIHMVLKYHASDLRAVPKETDVLAALRPFNISPGDYAMPHAGSIEGMKTPAFVEKLNKGPVAFMTVVPSGPSNMGSSLLKWFLYSVAVSAVAAYVGGRALGPGADYLSVFRFVGTTAFCCYAMALPQHSIWYRRNWGTTIRSMFDGLVYASLTAGTFGWLWPR
jgi:hypothetical protein